MAALIRAIPKLSTKIEKRGFATGGGHLPITRQGLPRSISNRGSWMTRCPYRKQLWNVENISSGQILRVGDKYSGSPVSGGGEEGDLSQNREHSTGERVMGRVPGIP